MSLMGERIYKMRKEKGWTMEQLAEKLGVQKSAVNKWEKGMVDNIKRNTIQNMAYLFDCNPVWLMGYDIKEDNEDQNVKTYRKLPENKEFTENVEAILYNKDVMEVVTAYMQLSVEMRNMVRRMLDLEPLEGKNANSESSMVS